ncbi:cupin-like domain-containing protein [Algibacillus agarilyticus]|uniref:cupin-like domain-containing protein n=1 Tax=Algibacillus agarilyticus TaxID=2234133 RepID=UPI000DCF9247|nr:cupin-like domain-containing protein [Algibacillus agarilyticus]
MRALKHVAVWHDVTTDLFQQEIAPLAEPAILKGLVKHWPLVECHIQDKNHRSTNPQDNTQSTRLNNGETLNHSGLFDLLSMHYVGGDVRMAEIKPGQKTQFYYNSAFNGFNFERKVESYSQFIASLTNYAHAIEQNPQGLNQGAVAIQSAPLKDYFPTLVAQHEMALFNKATTEPRFWLGNKSTVVAHYDDADNIACVVAGERQVTLFPPEQISHLYVGPLQFTPAGAPVSMVDLSEPDFEKYPLFKQALNHALVANLEPGDALYIPRLWWHHVQALSDINMLINFWAGGSIAATNKPVPMDAMLLAMLTIRDLPTAQKKAWQAFFDHYVFEHHEQSHQHIPEPIKGILAPLSSEQMTNIKKWLSSQLT